MSPEHDKRRTMKKLVYFVLAVLVVVAATGFYTIPVAAVKSLDEPSLCDPLEPRLENEIDARIALDPSELGSANSTFPWNGTCPGVALESGSLSGHKTYAIRVASDQMLGNFYIVDAAGNMTETSLLFQLYVPDNRVDEFTARGLHPVPFSQVTDWSWENMLGASQGDTVAQWVGKNIVLSGVGVTSDKLQFGLVSTSPDPANVFVAWREMQYKLFLPLIIR